MPNPVVHFEILGKDKDALVSFYEEVFAWKMHPITEEYTLATPTHGGIGGGIGAMGAQREHVTFYIAVDNLEEMLATIQGKGGQLGFGPHTIPDGSLIAGFLDPEGHLIGLIQPAPGITP